jgi:phosphoribosylamine--glycine ligase/phosphoribosylaminoimidazole synthetase
MAEIVKGFSEEGVRERANLVEYPEKREGDDTPKHECGVALLRLVRSSEYYDEKYYPYYAASCMRQLMEKQKNRGQDGAGVACLRFDAPPGEAYLDVVKSNSKVDPIDDCWAQASQRQTNNPKDFVGNLYLGHVRYGTFGGNQYENLHPVIKESNYRGQLLALAGNFNLTNTYTLIEEQLRIGLTPFSVTDTRLCLEGIGHHLGLELRRRYMEFCATGETARESMRLAEVNMDIPAVLRSAARNWDGGYLLCGIVGTGCAFALRDPNGIRPAFWYADSELIGVASEASALAHSLNVRDVSQIKSIPPGSALILPRHSAPYLVEVLPQMDYRSCVFERIYFSRPNNDAIYDERKKLGKKLAYLGRGVDRLIVSFVPNSAEVACYGLVEELVAQKIPVRYEKLVYKETRQRTFIQEPGTRAALVKSGYEMTTGLVTNDDTIIILDDSIVRGSTLKNAIVPKLGTFGAKRTIFASTAPQIRYPDCYGIDMARLDDLIAFKAAIQLLEDRGQSSLIVDVFNDCSKSLVKRDFSRNPVKRIYEGFTEKEISAKITEMVGCPDQPVEIIYNTIEDMHAAIPGHTGDWVFTGDFATPGGVEAVMRAFINYFEGSTARSYAFEGEKVIVLGSGGREHALAMRIAKSSKVCSVACVPGNGGCEGGKLMRKNIPVKAPFTELVEYCLKERISLVVVGPEQPLVDGVVDTLVAKGIRVFGPSAAAAEIESSKAYSKDFMQRHGIPTAVHSTFKKEQRKEAVQFIEKHWPVVVKASGLCAGKGVIVPESKEEAVAAFDGMLAGAFGSAGQLVVLEERLVGREVSVFALTDGANVICLPPAQDYKRALDGDMGLNTGGMGAICPVDVPPQDLLLIQQGIEKAVCGMAKDGRPFRGLLYAGIMLTSKGPMCLEYNCRFGDPETQAVMQVLEGDLYEALLACAGVGDLTTCELAAGDMAACCVVLASAGYPEKYKTGKLIVSIGELEKMPQVSTIHAGTTVKDGLLVTSGGRVLAVVAVAPGLELATTICYRAVSQVDYEGKIYRTDIGRARLPPDSPKLNRRSSYKEAGVDIDAGNAAVSGIKPFVKSTTRPECDVGDLANSFGGFFDMAKAKFTDPVLISGTDGVGTKLKIAQSFGVHDTIGQDLVAMCVNDCLVHGAEPLFFLDYFATGKLHVDKMVSVVKGISDGCKLAGCALIGGETAEMPGMYKAGEYDLAGFCVGAVERAQMIPDKTAKVGDVVVGIASSGVHSNGLSLVRALLEQAGLDVGDTAPWAENESVGESLLTPTRIYIQSVLPLMRAGRVKAAAHITGGGLLENLPRSLPENCSAKLDAARWELPPVIRWCISRGVAIDEALRAFNCGIGFALIVAPENADAIVADLNAAGEVASKIGFLAEGNGSGVSVWNTNAWATDVASQEKNSLQVGILAQGDEALGSIMAILDANVLSVCGVALLHSARRVEDFCTENGIPVTSCTVDHAPGVLQSFKADAIAAVNLPRSLFTMDLVSKWPDRLFASVPSLAPFVTGLEDADLVGFAVRSACKYTGCTVFRVVEDQTTLAGLPTLWPCAAQEVVHLEPGETPTSLQAKVAGRTCLGKAFVEALKGMRTSRFEAAS